MKIEAEELTMKDLEEIEIVDLSWLTWVAGAVIFWVVAAFGAVVYMNGGL